INTPEIGVYGVDHVKVAEGLGVKAIRVTDPNELGAAFEQAKKLAQEFQVPVVVEAILERVTNISMSKTVDMSDVTEFEELATEPGHAPTAIKALQV
ncbi:thiamine pyrophosphate-dependent enzyme, partial [Streptomyces virginiae]